MMDDVRGKRRCFFKTYAKGMQGGLINIWILLRVCNVSRGERGEKEKGGKTSVNARHETCECEMREIVYD